MGVIIRQSLKQSLVSYLAVAIGMINVLFIYTSFLSKEELGLVRFIIDTSLLIIPFVLLGIPALGIRFFPHFENKARGHHGFLFLLVLIPIIGFLVFLILTMLFQSSILSYYQSQFGLYSRYIKLILLLVFVLAYTTVFRIYCINFKRIVVPAIFSNLFLKIALPTLVILYFCQYLSFDQLMNGIVVIYFFSLMGTIWYVYKLGQLHLKPDFQFLNTKLIKEMTTYGFYGLLGGIGTVLALQIDVFMVGSLLDLSNVGIFAIAATIGNVIRIPRTAINNMVSPFIAQSWKDNDRTNIEKLYKKTSLNQFIIGLFLFIGICTCLDDLFSIMPNGDQYAGGKYVVYLLALSKVVDMVAGANQEVIQYSPYFRFNFYAILCLAVFNILTNLLLIPVYHINGAALATLISITLFNVVKMIYIHISMNMLPFSNKTLWVLAIGAVTFGLVYWLPSTNNALVNIAIKSLLIVIVFGGLTLYLKVSDDINGLAKQIYNRTFTF